MKRICIHQPDFAPYLGFFHRLLMVDTFIILDDVQFARKGGWHHRDLIKTREGFTWLTVAVKKGHLHEKINEVLLSDSTAWIEKNLNLLCENYQKAPFFGEFFPPIKQIYEQGHRRLVEFNMAFLRYFFGVFDLHVVSLFSSELNVPGQKNEKLINLIKAVGGTQYLSGTGARAYMDEALFEQARIAVEWQQFEHPVYPQLHGDFVPGLSCLDLLFNCGGGSKDILQTCLKK